MRCVVPSEARRRIYRPAAPPPLPANARRRRRRCTAPAAMAAAGDDAGGPPQQPESLLLLEAPLRHCERLTADPAAGAAALDAAGACAPSGRACAALLTRQPLPAGPLLLDAVCGGGVASPQDLLPPPRAA